jgi:predicted neuraminidase
MIYLFGIGNMVSVVYDENTLSEKDKSKATLVLKELPQPEEKEGMYHLLNINPDTKEIFYTYYKVD